MTKYSLWVMNSKGGVGKTTFSVMLVDFMSIYDRKPSMVEIDSRQRLSTFVGKDHVFSILGAPPLEELRKSPNTLLSHYDPIIENLEAGDSLIDIGANEDKTFLEYCELSRIEEDLEDLNVQVVAFFPTVMELESVRGAFQSMAETLSAVKSAKLVLVLNERDGDNFEKYFSEKDKAFLKKNSVFVMRVGKITSEGWEDFQHAHVLFSDIIDMQPSEISERFGYQRTKARRARGDIASWFGKNIDELSKILPDVVKDDEGA